MSWRDRLRFRRGRKLTSPDGLPVVELPPAYVADLRLYGIRSSYGHMYRTQPNVRSVVDFLAREGGSLNLKLYEKVPSGPTLPTGRLELDDHALIRVLASPSPGVTRSRLWKETFSDKAIYDVAYWRKFRIRDEVRAVVRVPPDALFPDRDPLTKRVRTYRTALGVEVPLRDLVVFHGYDPEQSEGNVSPLETLRRILAEEYAAGRNREHLWRNAIRKSGVVERPLEAPEWSFEAREAWRAEFESIQSGESNAGRVALLEDGMRWQEASWSPQEMEYLEARKLTREECSAAFGVDPRLVFASSEPPDKEARTGFYVDRLAPQLTEMAEEVQVQLLPDFEPLEPERLYLKFNLDERLRGSFEELAGILVQTTGRAFVEPNEARARLDLPPHPDGSGLTIPLNVLIGGQASPTSPLDTPGDRPAPGQTPGPPRQQASIVVSMTEAEAAWLRARLAIRPPDLEPEPEPDLGLAARSVLAARYAEVVRKHVLRQSRSLGSVEGASSLNSERWNRELAADLKEVDGHDLAGVAAEINAETVAALEGAADAEAALEGRIADAEAVGARLAALPVP